MTPYIETKKAEISQKFQNWYDQYLHDYAEAPQLREIIGFLGKEIETLLNDIESRVVFEPYKYDMYDHSQVAEGYNVYREALIEAFQHLRTGVEIEVCICPTYRREYDMEKKQAYCGKCDLPLVNQ